MRTRRRVVFSKLTAPEVLLAFPVPIVPPRPPAPPAPPVPAEAPPLFSLLGGVDDATTTPPPVPPMPPLPPLRAEAPPLFSLPLPPSTTPPLPPAPPVLPCASLSPVYERAEVSLLIEPRFVTRIVMELE